VEVRFKAPSRANEFQTEESLVYRLLFTAVNQIKIASLIPDAINQGYSALGDSLGHASVALYRVHEFVFDVGILFINVTTRKMSG
jgi:hypothetical protein